MENDHLPQIQQPFNHLPLPLQVEPRDAVSVEIRVQSPTPLLGSIPLKTVQISQNHMENHKDKENQENKEINRESSPLYKEKDNDRDQSQTLIMDPSQTRDIDSEIDSLLIYTKAVKWPTLSQSLTEKRFINRLFQLICGLGSFLNLGYTALLNDYTSLVLDESGIPFICFVGITSIFVSISNMFLYTFPGFLGIPPHRHHRISRVELTFDFIMCALWIFAGIQLSIYASCPHQEISFVRAIAVYLDLSSRFCPTLLVTLILGFLTALLFGIRMYDGLVDQRSSHDIFPLGKHIMFARGSWRN